MDRSRAETILAIDHGELRLGLAQWDTLRGLREIGVVRATSRTETLAKLSQVVAERRAQRVVVGLPLNEDGTEGPQAARARRFVAALARALPVPVDLVDEHGTSQEATAALGLGGRPLSNRQRGRVDARAAALLLRRYLRNMGVAA